MAEGRRREAWYHTALLATLQAEANRDRKQRRQPFSETDFHPDGSRAYGSGGSGTLPMTESDRVMLRRAFPGSSKQE